MMLAAVVLRRGKPAAEFLALNDVVVGKGAFSRLFHLKTSISGETISHFPADGMVVATATGSTGYSLSAGGPVVEPQVRVIILTPICAHTLSARSLVVPPDRVIEMELPDPSGEQVQLTADGQQGFELAMGDRVEVREAPVSARLVVLEGSGFYSRLRDKLGWGSVR
jgi:NAD+ kinase